MMEQVRVIDMVIEACHGCEVEEQQTPQPFRVNVTVDMEPLEEPEDIIENTVDYVTIISICKSVFAGPPRNLLETLAREIAVSVVNLPLVVGVEVEIEKMNPPIPNFKGRVGFRLYREKDY